MLDLMHRLRDFVDSAMEGRALQQLLSQNISMAEDGWWRVRGAAHVLLQRPTPKIDQVSMEAFSVVVLHWGQLTSNARMNHDIPATTAVLFQDGVRE
jgi:hypothetical protein